MKPQRDGSFSVGGRTAERMDHASSVGQSITIDEVE
jgi:hypothetical protein